MPSINHPQPKLFLSFAIFSTQTYSCFIITIWSYGSSLLCHAFAIECHKDAHRYLIIASYSITEPLLTLIASICGVPRKTASTC